MSLPQSQWQPPGRRMPSTGRWPIVWWIIGLNVMVYFVDAATERAIARAGYFSAATAIEGWQLWRFITFQFLHMNGLHLLFNMLSLFYFGPFVEMRLGRGRFTMFYLLCGVAGAAAYLLLWATGVLFVRAETPLIGASAGVFGVLVAAAMVIPNVQVMMMFPPIPMRLRTMVWIFLGIGLFTVISSGRNAGGEAAHLGGAALGWVLMRWYTRRPPQSRSRFWRPGDPPDRFFRNG